MAIFAYVQYVNHAYIVGGWVRKSPKTCLRNIWMVPNVTIITKPPGSGADYSIQFISIETYEPQFIGHNNIFLGSVFNVSFPLGNNIGRLKWT